VLILDNDTLKDSINDITHVTEFKNIPRKYHDKSIKLLFSAYGYTKLDTTVNIKSKITLTIYRKTETYGLIRGIVIDSNDNPVYNAQVKILEYTTNTDKKGSFSLLVPLAKQNSSDIGYIAIVSTDRYKTEEKVYPEGENNITNKIYIQ
jgi:hypothetical protein